MKSKKILSMITALMLIFGISCFILASCGGNGDGGNDAGDQSGENNNGGNQGGGNSTDDGNGDQGSGENTDGSGGNQDSGKKNYIIKIIGENGQPVAQSSFVVRIFDASGAQVCINGIGQGGELSVTLDRADYTVELLKADGKAFNCDPESLKISADSSGTTIKLYSTLSGGREIWINDEERIAKSVSEGEYLITFENDIEYFIFTPEYRGVHYFGAFDGDTPLSISYIGTPDYPLPENQAERCDDGIIKIEIRKYNIADTYDGNIATKYLIAIEKGSANAATLKIEVSDEDLPYSADELPWNEYMLKNSPTEKDISFANKKLEITDLDITKELSVILGGDGYYHLGDASGPIVYVRISSASEYLAPFSDVCENGQFTAYFYHNDGTFNKKITYNAAMLQYVNAADTGTGLYPLDANLEEIIKTCGEYKGWWKDDSINYIFSEVDENKASAWLFACCTIEYTERIETTETAPVALSAGGKLEALASEEIYFTLSLAGDTPVTFTGLQDGAKIIYGGEEYIANGGSVKITATAGGGVFKLVNSSLEKIVVKAEYEIS